MVCRHRSSRHDDADLCSRIDGPPLGAVRVSALAVVVGAVGICFAEGGSRVPTSGGPYGYIEAAFGRLAGCVASTALSVSNVLACGGVAAALGDVAVSVAPPALVVAVRVLVNVASVSRGAALVKIAIAVKLVPLIVFVAAGAFAMRRTNLANAGVPDLHAAGR